ncbi:MAG: response regulator [Erysipelotrichaceae bacterium]|nr:response regulator [Erysipelotrichaceae bacterium]
MCKDNGNGMSEEFLKKIFDPFERASSSTMSGIEGTGLGMSIVKKLVEAMDGIIMIQSKLHQGTTVLITIPMRYEKLSISTSSLENKKLLIIENSEQLKETYRHYLDEFAISFDIVDSSSEAIAAISDNEFRGQKFDALIIGTLSAMDGNLFDIASYFHKADPDLKIILASDDNWDEIEYRASRNGIRTFIPLPFFRKSLINSLNDALGQDDQSDPASSVPDLNGRTILLVEDNFINREIAKEILNSTNATIETAENGKEAVDMYTQAEDRHYSLILMDIQMPIMDGYEAARAIRASGKADAESIRIFAMTANTFVEDIAKAREAGMNGHIAKPIDINKLMLTLKQNS